MGGRRRGGEGEESGGWREEERNRQMAGHGKGMKGRVVKRIRGK